MPEKMIPYNLKGKEDQLVVSLTNIVRHAVNQVMDAYHKGNSDLFSKRVAQYKSLREITADISINPDYDSEIEQMIRCFDGSSLETNLEMEYQATFGIDCGVSQGFGIKYPDSVERTERIVAENPQDAYKEAMSMAGKFADDYLSNPDNGLTTVQLSSLNGPDGEVSFDASKSVVKRSMLEHLSSLASESKSKE